MRLVVLFFLLGSCMSALQAKLPNIVLVMTDDQGWGQTSYNGHPLLKTPNLDAMAENGLRFNRFYAGAPVCSPTRASVLTGRTPMRTGVETHGYSLRRQEKTLAQALQNAGYRTGHFGKWHLNGMRGPGVPIFANDSHHPGTFGFERWFSVTNFFDRDPIMSRQGDFVEMKGDSSEIIVDEALKFIVESARANKPSFSVIWFGTPHNPFRATEKDSAAFSHLDEKSKLQHGELVAMDRSIGTLRMALKQVGIAKNTIVWFCSDNGGLPGIEPDTVGGLRGNKLSMYEGGLRVPGIIEWPGHIRPRITDYPAAVMDMFPTLAELVDLPSSSMLQPQDGISLVPLLERELESRNKPIPFQCFGNTVLIDNDFKVMHVGKGKQKKKYELYDLSKDAKEENNLLNDDTLDPKIRNEMLTALSKLKRSIADSYEGKDYPEGRLLPENPEPRHWNTLDEYRPYFDEWRNRPEYRSRLAPKK